jgi:hypothetical protein
MVSDSTAFPNLLLKGLDSIYRYSSCIAMTWTTCIICSLCSFGTCQTLVGEPLELFLFLFLIVDLLIHNKQWQAIVMLAL